jgi:hypothetical protein
LQFDPVFLSWLVQLRNGVWIHPTYLAGAPDVKHLALTEALHREVESKLKNALRQFWLWSRIFGLTAPGPLAGWIGALIGSLPFGLLAVTESTRFGIVVSTMLPVLFRFSFEQFAMTSLSKLITAFGTAVD